MKQTQKSINQLVEEVHQAAVAKGWHEKRRTALEIHMLVVSEVAEASEAVRAGMPSVCQVRSVGLNDPETYIIPHGDPEWAERDERGDPIKPEGEAIELADAVIRVMDYFGLMGWDMQKIIEMKLAFNATRSHRHGGKAL